MTFQQRAVHNLHNVECPFNETLLPFSNYYPSRVAIYRHGLLPSYPCIPRPVSEPGFRTEAFREHYGWLKSSYLAGLVDDDLMRKYFIMALFNPFKREFIISD